MKSWKTTTAGVLTILGVLIQGGLALVNGHQPDFTTLSAGLTAGVGLILAADHSQLPPKP